MTAFHTMILFSDGAPLTPAGGSSCSLTDKMDTVISQVKKMTETVSCQSLYYYYLSGWSLGQAS